MYSEAAVKEFAEERRQQLVDFIKYNLALDEVRGSVCCVPSLCCVARSAVLGRWAAQHHSRCCTVT